MPTVGSHQQGAFATPVNGQSIDASVVLSNDNANRTTTNAHDADATIHVQSSLLASRPAAGTAGRPWITSDGLRFYLDSGSVWNELDYLSKTGGGTVAGAVTLSASLTAAAASFSGAVTLSASLTAAAASFSGAVTMASTLAVTGAVNGQTISSAASFTGSVAVASGLTVSSGTTAVQALTATTVTATGAIQLGDAQQVQWAGSNNAIRFTGTTFQLYPNGVLGFSVAAGGVGVLAGGLNVSSGTTAVQALTATTGTISTTGTNPLVLNRGDAAGVNGHIEVRRGGTARYYIGTNASDIFTLYNTSISPILSISDAGAATFASAVTVSAGGLAVTGNSTITGTLGGITTLTATSIAGTLSTAAQPNITSVGVLASPHMTSPVIDSGGLTVTAGGINVAGGHLAVQKQGMFGAYDGSGDGFSLHVSKDTAGTATGGAQTLPANPAGFLTWILGATTIKVPYYNN